jgi:predicted nucleic acid-binding protein
MVKEGWDLVFVSSAVESDAGKSDGVGIFITRLYFQEKIKKSQMKLRESCRVLAEQVRGSFLFCFKDFRASLAPFQWLQTKL